MLSTRAAIGCLMLAMLLAVVCHPRVFYGNGGTAMSIVSLDGVFFAGQWAALLFSLIAMILAVQLQRTPNAGAQVNAVAAGSALLFVWLIATGVPHPANEGEWRNRELGARAFVRGVAKRGKANEKPIPLTAESFAGQWAAEDGAVYVFASDAISWSDGKGSEGVSRDKCGAQFSIAYVQRERDVLQDLGLTWSAHAGAVYDATPAEAKIPVVHVACSGGERFVFIRATPDEVWRWNNAMDANDLKDTGFVLRRTPG